MTVTGVAVRARVAALLVLAAGCTADSSPKGPPATPPSSSTPTRTVATSIAATSWHQGRGGCLTGASHRRAQHPRPGHAVPSDFDGDGRSDLAVATDYANEDAEPKQVTELLSGPDGRPRCHALFWHGRESSSRPFGTTLATGDFDADGYADLAVGDPSRYQTTVLYGGPGGLTWQRSKVLRSHRTSFGRALAVADFDDDGYDDLAVSAPHDDGGAPLHRTAADEAIIVLWGGKAPLSMHRSYVIKPPAQPVQWFGHTLAAGDVTGDDYPELFETHGRLSRHKAPAPNAPFLASMLTGSPRGPQTLTGVPADAGPMTVGDLTGDGVGDLAVGHAVDEEVLVLPGSSTGLGAPTHLREDDPAVGGQAGAEHFFGAAVLAGRLDRRVVLLIGAPALNLRPDRSRLYVASPGTRSAHHPPITGDPGETVGAGSLQVRDVNGDERNDVVFTTYRDRGADGIVVRLGQADGGLRNAYTYWSHHGVDAWT